MSDKEWIIDADTYAAYANTYTSLMYAVRHATPDKPMGDVDYMWGKMLKKARSDAGWTQRDMAAHLRKVGAHMPKWRYAEIEREERKPYKGGIEHFKELANKVLDEAGVRFCIGH